MQDRVTGWWVFAGTLLFVAGVLNIIYGIAAIDDSQFFVGDAQYILSDLKTWGWVTLILGVVEVFAGLSLFAGGSFGRVVGVVAAAVNAVIALLTIPAAPFWSLALFALCVIVIHQLTKSPEGTHA